MPLPAPFFVSTTPHDVAVEAGLPPASAHLVALPSIHSALSDDPEFPPAQKPHPRPREGHLLALGARVDALSVLRFKRVRRRPRRAF